MTGRSSAAMRAVFGSGDMRRKESIQSDTDEKLVFQVAAGDAVAFEQLVGRYLPRVTALARRMLGDDAEAEDVAQECFLRLWDRAESFDATKASLATWLYRIAGNLCIDRLRRQKTRGVNEPIDAAIDLGTAADQEQAVHTKQLTIRVDQALQTLPDRQRQALVLCHFQGLKMKETSKIMEISVEALESLLARARRSLKKELEAEWTRFVPDIPDKP